MAALTDATLLWALKAIDLCYKYNLNTFVHARHGVRVLGLPCSGFAALVCVYAGRPKTGNRGPRDTALSSTPAALLDRLLLQQKRGLNETSLSLMPELWPKK